MGRQAKQGTSLNCVLLIFLVPSILLSAFAVRNVVSCCMTLPSNPSHEDFWSYLTEQPSLHVLLSHHLSHMCFSMSLTHLLHIKHFFPCLAFYRFSRTFLRFWTICCPSVSLSYHLVCLLHYISLHLSRSVSRSLSVSFCRFNLIQSTLLYWSQSLMKGTAVVRNWLK